MSTCKKRASCRKLLEGGLHSTMTLFCSVLGQLFMLVCLPALSSALQQAQVLLSVACFWQAHAAFTLGSHQLPLVTGRF